MADDAGAPATDDQRTARTAIEKQFPFEKQLAALSELRRAMAVIRDVFASNAEAAESLRPLLENLDHSTSALETKYRDVAGLLTEFLDGLPNIGGIAHRVDAYWECTRDDGIPIIWVPRPSVAHLLLDAPDREARVTILLIHEAEILIDCEACINAVTATPLQNMARLGRTVLGALNAGFPEPAQALAVNLSEQIIRDGLGPGSYRVHTETIDELRHLPLHLVRTALCLCPVLPFYRGWRRDRGAALPPFANRHVSVHQPTEAHSREHALVSAMLMSSLLREWQALGGEDGAFLRMVDMIEKPVGGPGSEPPRV